MNRERVGIADERAVAGLSRRQLLGAMTAAGVAGGFVGVSTGASLFDRESIRGRLATGVVDLVVASSVDDDPERIVDGSQMTVELGALEPGQAGQVDLRLLLPPTGSEASPNNPAYPWFRPSCIDARGRLVDDLRVTLGYVDCASGDIGAVVFPWGSLRQFVETFREGVALDGRSRPNRSPGNQACLDDPVCLRLDYYLRDRFEGKGDVRVDVDFVGTQCRNHTGEENPFAGRPGRRCDDPPEETPDYHGVSYLEVWGRVGGTGCTKLGRLEFSEDYATSCGGSLDVTGDDGDPSNDPDTIDENYIVEGVYDLPVDDDCADSGYDLHVIDTVTETEEGTTEVVGVEFELLNDDGTAGPALCKVVVKGGKGGGTVVYDDPSGFTGNATNGHLYAPENR